MFCHHVIVRLFCQLGSAPSVSSAHHRQNLGRSSARWHLEQWRQKKQHLAIVVVVVVVDVVVAVVGGEK